MTNLSPVLAVLALGACLVVGCGSDDADKNGSSAGSSGHAGSSAGRGGAGGASGGSTSVPGGAAGESGASADDGGSSGASDAGGAPDEAPGGSGNSSGEAGQSTGGGNGGNGGIGGIGGIGGANNGVCNELVNLGTAVTPVGSRANRPSWSGGTIVEGTYVLTSATEYNTSDTVFDETRKRTLKIAGNTVQIVNSDNGGPDVHATISIAPETNGPLLHAAFTCPTTTGTLADYFSATPTSLQLRKSGDERVYTYTLQP